MLRGAAADRRQHTQLVRRLVAEGHPPRGHRRRHRNRDGALVREGGNPQGLLRDDVADPQQIRDPGGLLRGQQDDIRVQEAVGEEPDDRPRRAHQLQAHVPAARDRVDNHLRLPGEGQDREALGDASVEADIRAEAEGDNDDRGGEFLPPGIHGRPQPPVRPQARHGIIRVRPGPFAEGNRLLPIHRVPKDRGQRIVLRLRGQKAPARRRRRRPGQDSAENRHRHLRHQVGKARRRVRREALGPG